VQEFITGQRWICDADSQLGLGTVVAFDARTVTIEFLASGETRSYSIHSAPLTRVIFSVGDTVPSHAGWMLTVKSISEDNGLLSYQGIDQDGKDAILEEGQIANFIQLNRPAERLFSGQIDPDKWFRLRYQSLIQRNRLDQSYLYGLIGCRTSLLPHQLYITHEVAHRYAPRVLLADEVGLGKTIEAGLILHQQLLTERAQRVLIVVPEHLVFQWLVEMLRRFNLSFSIFDEARCEALERSSGQDNPFHTEQLVLCSLDFLTHQTRRFQQALSGDWDLLVVDEAHHLHWSPESTSDEYHIVEQLSARTKGVLLLTATPEQFGKASHFARLRLLDPNRFPDFDAFVEEENSYQPIAKAVEDLLDEKPLKDTVLKTIVDTIQSDGNERLIEVIKSKDFSNSDKADSRQLIIDQLLDHHGTGRVLFRNTRAAVQGFSRRKVSTYPLALPGRYAECLSAFKTNEISTVQLLLCPELLYQADDKPNDPGWTRIDPRIDWLAGKLKQLKPEKVLVIAASADTAIDVGQALKSCRIISRAHGSIGARSCCRLFCRYGRW